MEISPVPRRRTVSPRVRLGLVVVVLAPVTLLALLPTMFGLQRYVISSETMAGSIERGSVVLERQVATSRLEVGDVITFEAPPGHGVEGLVTHRIVAIDTAGIRTRGDAMARPDPWTLRHDVPTRPRVLLEVPYVGYPFLETGSRVLWAAVAVGLSVALAGALLGRVARGGGRRAGPPGPDRAGPEPPGTTPGEPLARLVREPARHPLGGSG